MKKAGVTLILAGLLAIIFYVVYTVITLPEIPVLIKVGLVVLVAGTFILITGLIIEKRKNGEDDSNDISNY